MQLEEAKIAQQMQQNASTRPRNLNIDKRVQAKVKIPTNKRLDEPEVHGAEVEEIPAGQFPQLTSRSKKISKSSGRK